MTDHALTPAAAERRLIELEKQLEMATEMLKIARDAEVEAKHTFEAARRRAGLSAECPRVERGGTTVAERTEWIEDKAAEDQWKYDIATAARQAAYDHLQTTREQGMMCMALLRSANTAYAVSGGTP